ncbi:MAG: sialate O-acetylesterase [Balneolales bacterium]|nr:sialate O-acetylesterase [Balneolales bacterium]
MKKSLLFLLGITSSTYAQELMVPIIFSDHMVLQRDENIKFWGWDVPGEHVTITLNGSSEITTANNAGYWQVYLPKQQAGGPFEVNIAGSSEIVIEDVYIGDVWIAGGQSNMEWKLNQKVNNWEEEIANSDIPEIRFFDVPNVISYKPEDHLSGGVWKIANPENSPEFSAVAWHFAKLNHSEKHVPVGIIESNWGGTPAQAWTPAERLQSVEGYQGAAMEVLAEPNWEEVLATAQQKNEKRWARLVDQTELLEYGAHEIEFNDSEWSTIELPNSEALHDYIWLRKSFSVGSIDNAVLSFGNPGKFTVAFLNGQQIYHKIWSDEPRLIHIDKNLLEEGENVLAIRTVEDWDNRTFIGSENDFWISIGNQKIDLSGTWKFSNTLEPELGDYILYEHSPGFLYNSMIHPIAGYSVKGAIWYQGESNVGHYFYYHKLFSAMIEEWRDAWGQGDFPFLFVQLANFLERSEKPQDSYWAGLREAQTQTLSVPATGMAAIIDIGEADDIHPRNKKDVGFRLWQAARYVAFNEQVIYSGPMYRSHSIEGDKVEITFDFAENGWQNKNYDQIEGFAVAGSDSVFHWAEAEIDKNMIRVWSEKVSNPIAVRYAWADNPKVSLYNKEGLPMVPFRTDNWKY